MNVDERRAGGTNTNDGRSWVSCSPEATVTLAVHAIFLKRNKFKFINLN